VSTQEKRYVTIDADGGATVNTVLADDEFAPRRCW
jgi:hypothetical protein